MGESLTRSPSPLVVEFVGLPGAGKTTICDRVAERLRECGISLISRREILQEWHRNALPQKIIQLLPTEGNDSRILLNSLLFAARVKPIALQSFLQAGKVFTNVKRNEAVARSGKYQVLLLDQGLLQEIWSVVLTGSVPPKVDLHRAMTAVFSNRSMVFIDFKVDIETALSRIGKRSSMNSCFDKMESDRAYSALLQYAPFLQIIVDFAREMGMTVLEIDGNLSVEDKVETIVAWIVEFKSSQF